MSIPHDSQKDIDCWLENSEQSLVVVVFTALWSGNSRILMTYLNAIAKSEDALLIFQVDVEAKPELGKEFSIHFVPTTIIFRNREIVDYFSLPLSKKKLSHRILALLSDDWD